MKVHEFLEHHGIAGNPFAEEDAQTDSVFKRDCLETTFHPAWDKILGSPAEPSTSIVFGEKGSGKTALKLQMVRQFERHNAAHPEARTFVVLYDDFNPFLDRFVGRVAHGRSVEKTLAQWKLWDHMDAILSLAVTQLVTELVADKRSPRLTRPQARTRPPAAMSKAPPVPACSSRASSSMASVSAETRTHSPPAAAFTAVSSLASR